MARKAQKAGIDISSMQHPVYVRRRTTPMSEAQRAEFARQANQSDIAAMSPAEKARTDAARLSDDDLADFAPNESGNVLAAPNAPFLRRFAHKAGDVDNMRTADGRWNKRMADRVQAAVFSKAYDDPRLLELATEESDPEIRTFAKNKDPERYPYPYGDEMVSIGEAFDRLFDTLDTRATEHGVALFSRSETDHDPEVIEARRQAAQVRTDNAEALRAHRDEGKPLPAPNGRPSKLTEHQWVAARTPNFRAWFGDWLGKARLAALREMSPIALGNDTQAGESAATVRRNLRAPYRDLQKLPPKSQPLTRDGRRVRFGGSGWRETKQHAADTRVLRIIPDLPRLIEQAVPLFTAPPRKGSAGNVVAFHHYGVKVGFKDGPAYVRILLRELTDGTFYYDNNATEIADIEKALMESPLLPRSQIGSDPATSGPVDRLVDWAQRVNDADISKIVDDNGEPLVVYHGSNESFDAFDPDYSSNTTTTTDGEYITPFFFSSSQSYARGLAGDQGHVESFFLSIKNPAAPDIMEEARRVAKEIGEPIPETTEDAEQLLIPNNGYDEYLDDLFMSGQLDVADGVVFRETKDGFHSETDQFVALDPAQIKSATGNRGTYSRDDNRLNYSRPNEPASAAQARQRVDAIESSLAPMLKHVRREIPAEVSHDAPETLFGPRAKGVEGAYHNGRIVLFGRNIASPERAQQVLRHEAIGHFGMERMLGDNFRPMLADVRRLIQNNGEAAAIAQRVRDRYDVGQPNGLDESSDTFVQEVVAAMAEAKVDLPIMRRIIAHIRAYLRRIGLAPKNISQDELYALLAQAGRLTHDGGRVLGIRPVPATYSAPIPTYYSGMADVLANKLPGKGPAAQMKAAIEAFAKKGQIKPDELAWSGIADWLDEQQGTITRADVLSALAERGVTTEETIRKAAFQNGRVLAPKYSEFQLPGGTDYREILIRLPKRSSENTKAAMENADQAYADTVSNVERLRRAGALQHELQAARDASANARADMDRLASAHHDAVRSYHSLHFDESNILAHLRVSERIDADGKRVLFIEELQSDWHQEGRNKGYEENIGVPDAPFKKTWPLLAMKRAIRYAADNGHERIAWTTGGQQAARYDLSKSISKIGVYRRNGMYSVEAHQRGQENEGPVIDKIVPESELPDVVGKELADRIVSDLEGKPDWTASTYEGLDLNVGGSGMTAFYDAMLPSIINKYVKKWGAKTGHTTIDTPGYEAGDTQTVHSIEVTPEMREAAAAGQPLFSRRAARATSISKSLGLNARNDGRDAPTIVDRASQGKIADIEKSFETRNSFDAPEPKDSNAIGLAGYRSLGREQVMPEQALADAQALTGIQGDVPVVRQTGMPKTTPMRINARTGQIEVNADIPLQRHDAAAFMTEELYHGLDVLPTGNSIAASSARMRPGGDLWTEAQAARDANPVIGEFLAYPMDMRRYPGMSTARRSAELFARLNVLYSGNRENFRRSFPHAWRLSDGIARALDRRNSGLRGDIQPSADERAQVQQLTRQNQDAGRPSGSRGQDWRADPGLEPVRQFIARELKGSRLGRRVPASLETRSTDGHNELKPSRDRLSAEERPAPYDGAPPRRRFGRKPPEPSKDPWFAENQRLRDQDKKLWDRAGHVIRREFTAAGDLPKIVFQSKIDRDSQFNAVELDTRHLVGVFQNAIKKDYGRSWSKLSAEQQNVLHEALGGQVSEAIPRDTRTALVGMRRYIDHLSGEYIHVLDGKIKRALGDLGEQAGVSSDELAAIMDRSDAPMAEAQKMIVQRLVNRGADPWTVDARVYDDNSDIADALAKAATLNTIKNNIGRYVHRSYKAFDDPKWNQNIPQSVSNAAFDYLQQRYEEQGESPAEARRLAEQTGNRIVKTGTAYSDLESFIAESKLGAKDLSVLQRRKEIAPEIRALLGEYTDPRINFAKSATKMGRLVWNDRFLTHVKDAGMGSFLFTDREAPATATEKIAAEGSDVFAPLNGLYTYPEVAQAFKDAVSNEHPEGILGVLVQINGLTKYGLTVLSPTTAARNWQSAALFALANGHFDVRQMRHSVSGLQEYFTHNGKGAKLAYLRRLQELGVIYDTPYAGQMMDLLADSKIQDDLLTAPGKMSIKKLMGWANKFYQYGDDFWKIMGFENEKNMLMKRAGMSREAAEIEAAERIRNTYPTYSMVPKAIKALRRFPLAGPFVAFTSEIVRTQGHMLRYMAHDLATPGMRSMGIQRAAGMVMASAGIYAAQALTRTIFGVDDDEEEAVRVMAAPWNKNSNLLFTGRDAKGTLTYIDLSFLDPYNYFKRPINAMLRDQSWGKAALSGAADLASPFISSEIGAQAIGAVLYNQKPGGYGHIYDKHDWVGEQSADIATFMATHLSPGAISWATRMSKALEGERKTSGQPYNKWDEAAAFFGWRVTRLNPKIAMHYHAFDFKDALANAQHDFYHDLRSPNTIDDDTLRADYAATLAKRRAAFSDMAHVIAAAKKAGLKRPEIYNVLSSVHVSKADIADLLNGRTPRWRPTDTARRYAVDNAYALYDRPIANRIRERYNRVMRMKPPSADRPPQVAHP